MAAFGGRQRKVSKFLQEKLIATTAISERFPATAEAFALDLRASFIDD